MSFFARDSPIKEKNLTMLSLSLFLTNIVVNLALEQGGKKIEGRTEIFVIN